MQDILVIFLKTLNTNNMKPRYYIGKHCIERYIERVRMGINTADKSVIGEMLETLVAGKDITQKIYDEVPRYILFLYEKYKELGLTIIESKDIIFISRKRPGTLNMYDVVTCYSAHRHLEQFKNTEMKREDIFIKIKQIKKTLK